MADLDYVKVVGRLGITRVDGDDVDTDPDTVWCDEGTVTFTPLVTSAKVVGGTPAPWTLGNSVITATIDDEGYLTVNGARGVGLVDLGSDKLNPRIDRDKSAYQVKFINVKCEGSTVKFPDFACHPVPSDLLPDGVTANDLALMAPVSKTGGTPIVQGPPGEPGKQGPPGIPGVNGDGEITSDVMLGVLEDDSSSFAEAANHAFGPVGANAARFVRRAQAGEVLKVTCLGDSILEGHTVTDPETDGAMILLAQDLSTRFGVTVTQANHASSGFTALREFTDGNVTAALAENADLYVVSAFDKNDLGAEINGVDGLYAPGYPQAQSLAGVERMIRAIRRDVPKADIIVLTTNPYVAGSSSNAFQDAKDKAVRAVAAAYGCELVDGNAAFKAQGDYSDLMHDSTHPNTAGHRLLADTLLAHLKPGDKAPIMAAQPGVKGLYAPETVNAGGGSEGVDVALVTGSNLSNQGWSWANSGTWTGTGGSNPFTTKTVGSYLEITGRVSEVHLLMSTADADDPVCTVTVDGSTVSTGQHFNIGKKGTYYVPVAVGLDPAVSHTVRLTLTGGALKVQRTAVVLSATNATFSPDTALVDLGTNNASQQMDSAGGWVTQIDQNIALPFGWQSAIFTFTGYVKNRVLGTSTATTTTRQFNNQLVLNTDTPLNLEMNMPATDQDWRNTAVLGCSYNASGSVRVRVRTRVLSHDKDSCWNAGYALQALLTRTA